MSGVYGVMADLHLHRWSQFASLDAEGRNTRLMEILREVDRCCETVVDAGGDIVWIAGDIFHVRGSVEPEVLNPLKDCLWRWYERIQFRIIPGNHDLSTRETTELGSAVRTLDDMDHVHVYHRAGENIDFCWVPWHHTQGGLLKALEHFASHFGRGEADVFIHAGIDGVIPGMPDHGLTADRLADFGFRRVFAGHYHNHKDLGRGIYSIGAPVHHTWGDIGAKAGWLLVTESEVKWQASHAPSFIEITEHHEPEDLPLIVDGHYVRARIGRATAAEVKEWREQLTEMGARGVLIESTPASTPVRVGGIARLSSLEEAIKAYVPTVSPDPALVSLCSTILKEAQA